MSEDEHAGGVAFWMVPSTAQALISAFLVRAQIGSSSAVVGCARLGAAPYACCRWSVGWWLVGWLVGGRWLGGVVG